MKIELKKDKDGDTELYIAGNFIASWGGDKYLDALYENKETYIWFQLLMEIAVETGQERGATETQNVIKQALGIGG